MRGVRRSVKKWREIMNTKMNVSAKRNANMDVNVNVMNVRNVSTSSGIDAYGAIRESLPGIKYKQQQHNEPEPNY